MAGHSKWAQIKRKKEAKDQKKGQIFSKLAREITLAAMQGGSPDPAQNVRLRMVIERAKQFRMPKENIQRAIDRAFGSDSERLTEQMYEGLAPGGVGLLIYALTDNNNRTLSEIRQLLDKEGARLVDRGTVEHMFRKVGIVFLPVDRGGEDGAFEVADKIGAEDIRKEDNEYIIIFPLENLSLAREILEEKGFDDIVPEMFYYSEIEVPLPEKEYEKIEEIVEKLEELDDVQKVFHNAARA